ncbi:MAG TPA: SURF1 family protein [Burkholderiales bacterium]|nr:SURF1 family protein [Burkholderiales bacterium]
MKRQGARFRLRPVWLVVAVTGCALFVALGNWQSRRAEEKLAAQARLDALAAAVPVRLPATPVAPGDYAGRRVTVRGEYVPKYSVLIDNRIHKGVAGYYIVTPFRIEDGATFVLVNRGWVAAGPRRDDLPRIATRAGIQSIEGVAMVPGGRVYELAPDVAHGPVRQNLVIERIAAETGLPLQPLVIQQTSDAGDGLVRAWERPDSGVNTHRAYALQWYALALLTMIVYIVLGFRRVRAVG